MRLLLVCLIAVAMVAIGWSRVLADPCQKAHPLQQEATSPCDGVLLPAPEAKRGLSCLKVELPDCEKTAELDARECDVKKTELKKQRDAHKKRADALDNRLAVASSAPQAPWHERPWFVATASVLSTALVAVAVWGIVSSTD